MECKFKVGSYYKDREGHTEQVESIDISSGKIETNVARYFLNGHYRYRNSERNTDLVPIEVDHNGNLIPEKDVEPESFEVDKYYYNRKGEKMEVDQNGNTLLTLEVGKKYVAANERVFEIIFERDGQYLATEVDPAIGRGLSILIYNSEGILDSLSSNYMLVSEYKEPQASLVPMEVDQNVNVMLSLEVGKKYVAANERVFEVIFERDGQYLATEVGSGLSILIYNSAGIVESLYPPRYRLVSEYKEPQVSYVNVYRNLVSMPHMTRELADAAAATQKDGDRIACIKITEGQYDE